MDADVVVKSIQIYIPDDEFNELETDYRGNPKFSTMITKLCNCAPRSEFILSVLENELRANPDQQVMILAHNKSLLAYLYDAIADRNIAGCGTSVGYYLGGMKDADLKASENKKVIIATYAMASEGLDIPTLTTLIMATPKTDVCQSVGRILRTKHTHPLVIDFVDHHDIFKSQWMKRQSYYVKQGYHIMYTTNTKYGKNIWKVREKPTTKAVVPPVPVVAATAVPAKSIFAFAPRNKPASVAALMKMTLTTKNASTNANANANTGCGIQL
jgi:hypothetical protein